MPVERQVEIACRFKHLAMRFFTENNPVCHLLCFFLSAFKYQLSYYQTKNLKPDGLSLRFGPPLHKVCSFNWMVSVSTFPYIMAPNRPFPMGNAFSQVVPEGWLYHNFRPVMFCDMQVLDKISKMITGNCFIELQNNLYIRVMPGHLLACHVFICSATSSIGAFQISFSFCLIYFKISRWAGKETSKALPPPTP